MCSTRLHVLWGPQGPPVEQVPLWFGASPAAGPARLQGVGAVRAGLVLTLVALGARLAPVVVLVLVVEA